MAAEAHDDVSLPNPEREPKSERARRGRRAKSPLHIPWNGWKDILWRVKQEIVRDKVSEISASLAYYAMLAIFPALIGLTSIYGILFDPVDVQVQLNALSRTLPPSARSLLTAQLQEIVHGSDEGHGLGLVLSILGVLWTASTGTSALISAINTVYDEEESCGFLKLRTLALVFTLGFILAGVIAFGLVAVLPALLDKLGLGAMSETILAIGRWPALALLVITGLSLLYRYAPNRRRAKWQWINWGSIVAAAIWTLASSLLSAYVSNFANYNKTYGALGGVIVLLLWFYVSGFVILLGAELNAEIEHQTRKDSTVDPEKPIGERGAEMADTVGEGL